MSPLPPPPDPTIELSLLRYHPSQSAADHVARFEKLVSLAYPSASESRRWNLFAKTLTTPNFHPSSSSSNGSSMVSERSHHRRQASSSSYMPESSFGTESPIRWLQQVERSRDIPFERMKELFIDRWTAPEEREPRHKGEKSSKRRSKSQPPPGWGAAAAASKASSVISVDSTKASIGYESSIRDNESTVSTATTATTIVPSRSVISSRNHSGYRHDANGSESVKIGLSVLERDGAGNRVVLHFPDQKPRKRRGTLSRRSSPPLLPASHPPLPSRPSSTPFASSPFAPPPPPPPRMSSPPKRYSTPPLKAVQDISYVSRRGEGRVVVPTVRPIAIRPPAIKVPPRPTIEEVVDISDLELKEARTVVGLPKAYNAILEAVTPRGIPASLNINGLLPGTVTGEADGEKYDEGLKEDAAKEVRAMQKAREEGEEREREREANERRVREEEERKAREEEERKANERRAKEEEERKASEQRAREEEERRANEERAREAREREERLREERLREERLREERLKAEKLREDRLREERLREERLREERLRAERAREERYRQERAREEKAREERRKEQKMREEQLKLERLREEVRRMKEQKAREERERLEKVREERERMAVEEVAEQDDDDGEEREPATHTPTPPPASPPPPPPLPPTTTTTTAAPPALPPSPPTLLITHASTPLGSAISTLLSSLGASLILHYHQTDPSIVSLLTRLRAARPAAHVSIVFGDLRDPRAADAVVRRAAESGAGGLAGAVWCPPPPPGGGRGAGFLDAKWDADGQVQGLVHFMQSCIRRFTTQPASPSADFPLTILAPPSSSSSSSLATRTAISSLVPACAAEFAPNAVRVNAVLPASHNVDPDHVARTVEWLCGPASRAVSGVEVRVGGRAAAGGWW